MQRQGRGDRSLPNSALSDHECETWHDLSIARRQCARLILRVVAYRQKKREAGSVPAGPLRAAHSHEAAVLVHNSVGDPQAQTRPLFLLRSKERLEDGMHLSGWDARAAV